MSNSIKSETSIAGVIKGKSCSVNRDDLKNDDVRTYLKPKIFRKTSKNHLSFKKKASKSKLAHSTSFQKKDNQKFHYRFEPNKQSLTKMVDSSSEFSMISGNINNNDFNKQSIGYSSTMMNNKINEELDNSPRISIASNKNVSSKFGSKR